MSVDELFGSVLASNPPIVENILKHLNFKNLNVCSCVCKLWNVISQTLKKARQNIFYTVSVCHIDWPGLGEALPSNVIDTSLDVGRTFCNSLDNNFCDSKFGLIFCSRNICSKPQAYFFGFREYEKRVMREIAANRGRHLWNPRPLSIYDHRVMDFLSPHIPRSCKVVFCSSEGVIGTPPRSKIPIECEDRDNPAISGIFFPEYKGVNFCHFAIDHKIFSTNSALTIKYSDLNCYEPIKCLLVFTCTNPRRSRHVKSFINHLLLKQEGNIAIGGAVVDEVCLPCNKSKMCSNIAIAFSGDNVTASSLILDNNIRTPAQVEERLKLFKDYVTSEGENYAYMFTCVERGSGFYNEPNVESSVFAKLYPGIPLFGVFCYGEIGVEHLPNKPTPRGIVKVDKWLRSYTTIFVLLSFKI